MEAEKSEWARRLLGYAWLCALGVALVFSALTTDRKARQVEEYACFCDPFGYLQIAQDTRQAVATHRLPDFSIESPHSRLLIDVMKSRGLSLRFWDDLVAPLCYHYSARADHIGVQYPPGAGLLLAVFPQGVALHRLDRLVIVLFVAIGLLMLVVAAVKQTWLSAGLLVLALIIGLEMLARIGNASFSVNAMFAPILLASLCWSATFYLRADRLKSFYVGWLLMFVAGLLFGFAILVRLQVAFMLPGLVMLFWPWRLRRWYQSALVSFLLGVFLGGVLPVVINQSRVTGAWHQSTYGIGNTDPPTLSSIRPNLLFYFGAGKPSQYNWALLVMLAACAGLFLWTRRRTVIGGAPLFLALSWRRLSLAVFFLWIIPTAYFLTHEVIGHHYPIAHTFVVLLVLAFGAAKLDINQAGGSDRRGHRRRALAVAGFMFALAPGLFAMEQVATNYVKPTAERLPRQFTLPAELADEHAWVWAAELTGTLWYYARKPAHKINFTSPETRVIAYEFVLGRGEPQYIIRDSPVIQIMEAEIIRLGGTLERRGEVDGYPYFLIHWPPGGPRQSAAL